ncbi:MAG: pre-rRNA-processing protein PNO1 [Candidatus Nanohalobium sp.]
MKEVKIPEERVGVLIGEGGETKEEFEDYTDCELVVEDNVARIEGDALAEMNAQKVVKAIGRGFAPDKAFKLMERDTALYIIDIGEYATTSNSRDRLKGRVIGREGEARRHIEKMCEIDMVIYGKTIGMIGKAQNIEVAQEAVNMLLNGSSHSTAYNFLEKNQAKIVK